MTDFATIVRNARLEMGLTLQQLADKIGTEKGYCSGVENRKVNPPSPKIVKRMAKLFGIDPVELLVYSFIEKAPKEIRDIIRSGALSAMSKLSGKCLSCQQARCVCDMGQEQPSEKAESAPVS